MKRILVIGELCHDHFIYGDCERLCPEAPVPVFRPYKETKNRGMAGNVVDNIYSLQPDWRVNFLCNQNPIIKTRYVDSKSGQMLLRVDNGDTSDPIEIDEVETLLSGYDAVVISDYCKGFLDIDAIARIGSWCYAKDIPTFLDTKKTLGPWSLNIDYLKINSSEAAANKKSTGKMPFDSARKATIITNGGAGCDLFTKDTNGYTVNGYRSEVREVSGAGDSFLAGFVCKMLETNNLLKSAEHANLVASIAVSHRGVVAVTKQEVEAKEKMLDSWNPTV